MQKSQNGGGNNAYKIFTSQVEEGSIPDTISNVKLFMTTMKMKNNFCDGYQYEIQKSRDGGGNNAYKIFTSQVEDGIMPIKSLQARWRRDTFQTQHPMWNCS